MTDGPFNEHIELEHGGDLNIVRFGDGVIRVSYEKDGVRVGLPITIQDLRSLRLAALSVVIADHLAGLRS